MKIYLAFLLAASMTGNVYAQTINASQAKDYIGKNVTVCDQVFSVIHATNVNREPTFLDYGAKYPDMIFAVVV